jgi:hypothetical protein
MNYNFKNVQEENILFISQYFKNRKLKKILFKTKVVDSIYDLNPEGSVNRVDWSEICKTRILSENFMREYDYFINYNYISKFQKLSERYIRDCRFFLNWVHISEYQKMSLEFMEYFKDSLNWTLICQNNIIPIDYLERLGVYVSWEAISEKELTLEQIRHYNKYLNWDSISKLQDLNEEIITEFQEQVNWDMLYKYNCINLSYDFIKKNIYKINKNLILGTVYGKFSEKKTKELKRLVKFKNLFENN